MPRDLAGSRENQGARRRVEFLVRAQTHFRLWRGAPLDVSCLPIDLSVHGARMQCWRANTRGVNLGRLLDPRCKEERWRLSHSLAREKALGTCGARRRGRLDREVGKVAARECYLPCVVWWPRAYDTHGRGGVSDLGRRREANGSDVGTSARVAWPAGKRSSFLYYDGSDRGDAPRDERPVSNLGAR